MAHVCNYSREWESVVQQWAVGNFAMAQPLMYFPDCFFGMLEENIRNVTVARQELLQTETGSGQLGSMLRRQTGELQVMKDAGLLDDST